jgi:chorismate synthase
MNTFGKYIRLTTFGESHGTQIGGILDGLPANLSIDFAWIEKMMQKRRPGQSNLTTSRDEDDDVEIVSGINENKTTGAPISFFIKNKNQKSNDYDYLKKVYRPSHADFTYAQKYQNYDVRGGGRSSARETANWVAAAAIIQPLLNNIEFSTYVSQIGDISLEKRYEFYQESQIDLSIVKCPEPEISKKMEALVYQTKEKGDSVGGIITCIIRNVPIGLGQPIFDKLEARLALAMLSINASKGFEIGEGFQSASMFGSQHNDVFIENNKTKTNHSGGTLGGISNGMDIQFRVAFKPVSTIFIPQETKDIDGNDTVLINKGRHDPCVVPRAVVIVESMAKLVLADFILASKLDAI